MWFTINILLFAIGFCLIAYAKYIDSSENYYALTYALFGALIVIIGSFSSIALGVTNLVQGW